MKKLGLVEALAPFSIPSIAERIGMNGANLYAIERGNVKLSPERATALRQDLMKQARKLIEYAVSIGKDDHD